MILFRVAGIINNTVLMAAREPQPRPVIDNANPVGNQYVVLDQSQTIYRYVALTVAYW